MYIFVVWYLIRGMALSFFTFVWSWIRYFRKVISYKEIKMVVVDHFSEIQLVPQNGNIT
jgi:hypothetical protein